METHKYELGEEEFAKFEKSLSDNPIQENQKAQDLLGRKPRWTEDPVATEEADQ